MPETPKVRFYQKNWFIILMLIIIFPVGLVLMWMFTDWTKKSKGIVTLVVITFFVLVPLNDEKDETTADDEIEQEENTETDRSKEGTEEMNDKENNESEESSDNENSAQTNERQKVKMNINPSLQNDIVALDFETNIEEGAKIHYDIIGDDIDDFETGEFEVTSNSFTQEIDISSFENSSSAEIFIHFQPALQEKEYQNIYGEYGENIYSDSSYFHKEEAEEGFMFSLRAVFEMTLN